MSFNKFELVRDANVEVTKAFAPSGAVVATINVNDKYQHRFDHTSRISKHLKLMSPEQLGERLSGGTFMFVDDQLVDFRDGEYKNFIHTDRDVSSLMDHIGVSVKKPRFGRLRRNNDEFVSNIALRNQWSEVEFNIPHYKDGGEFNSALFFNWSPFQRHIGAAFDVMRLICTNGMVATSSLIDSKIPMINRWEQHMDIASNQLQGKIDQIVKQRLEILGSVRASVGDCMQLMAHLQERAKETVVANDLTRISRLGGIINPVTNLNEIYKQEVFSNGSLAKQLPAHVTGFDLFNIVTELRSHTNEVNKSSNFALDRIANRLLFDYDGTELIAHHNDIERHEEVDHDQAFIGAF